MLEAHHALTGLAVSEPAIGELPLRRRVIEAQRFALFDRAHAHKLDRRRLRRRDDDGAVGRERVCSEAALAVDLAVATRADLDGVHRWLEVNLALLTKDDL